MVRKRIIWFSKRPPIIEQTEELKKLLDGGDITTDLLVKESRVKFDSMVEVTQAANIIFNAINRALANGISNAIESGMPGHLSIDHIGSVFPCV